jgi:hypothetical protein
LFFPVSPRFFSKSNIEYFGFKKTSFFFGLPKNRLTLLTPPFLGGFSAKVCEISSHNSDFLYVFGQMMVNLLCKWLVYFEKLLFTLFQLSVLVNKYQGWIYGGGGGSQGCTPLLALVNRGAKGVQKNQIQKYGTISKVFFFFLSQTEAHNSMPILQEMAFLGF